LAAAAAGLKVFSTSAAISAERPGRTPTHDRQGAAEVFEAAASLKLWDETGENLTISQWVAG
jgi:hypothetical protein